MNTHSWWWWRWYRLICWGYSTHKNTFHTEKKYFPLPSHTLWTTGKRTGLGWKRANPHFCFTRLQNALHLMIVDAYYMSISKNTEYVAFNKLFSPGAAEPWGQWGQLPPLRKCCGGSAPTAKLIPSSPPLANITFSIANNLFRVTYCINLIFLSFYNKWIQLFLKRLMFNTKFTHNDNHLLSLIVWKKSKY